MTQTEFDRWWADVVLRFPSIDAWLVKVTSQDAVSADSSQRAVLRTWFDVLGDVNLTDALEVNRQMQSGELEWVGDYDGNKERLPQHVRRLARQMSWERHARPTEETRRDLTPTSFPAGKILRRMSELAANGVERDAAKKMALEEFPIGQPNYEPRYRCLVCLDVGRVFVASNPAIEYMLADRFHECRHRIAVVRCTCKAHLPTSPKYQLATYDKDKCFKIKEFTWPESEVQEFRDWVELKKMEYWDSKREHAFDQFNEREFAP